ncbi:DNA cytosine methyltransferase [Pseudobutyrivibrio xylanivorans]|uniref:DNA (cytosine-5-)-methyltransferase n=1 Tax=Pseudobutyrivibrio xylanivorans TaxID=185007 RepID=A0A5P6VRP5_PSEXY|nr:DNA cytosine methyltransferase [Pseudobutyrivibrio xylanivorans]QFJ55256.1 DNA cytosine methyltransferase [Pseudobutyrivibrio xylanivorans]
MKFKGLSLFSNVGIAETYLKDVGIDIVVANELIEERAEFYKHLYPDTDMVIGDITDEEVFNTVMEKSKAAGVDFLIATPPCQGMSLAGKMDPKDVRNQLIYYAVKAIKELKPKYVLLENVPQQLRTIVNIDGEDVLIPEYLHREFADDYFFAKESLVSARDYGVPQMRKRNIVLLTRYDQKYRWEMPKPFEKEITLRDILWDVPSLDPFLMEGEEETLKLFPDYLKKKEEGLKVSKWHYPPRHSKKLVVTMMHTPSGCTAFDNDFYYPKKKDGTKVNGHYNTYRRHAWDKPCRTITQNSGVISSLCCVHPGKPIVESDDDTKRIYSDARCFSIYELMLVTSLPKDWNIPEWATEKLIRSVIGEGIPPVLVKNIVKSLVDNV